MAEASKETKNYAEMEHDVLVSRLKVKDKAYAQLEKKLARVEQKFVEMHETR